MSLFCMKVRFFFFLIYIAKNILHTVNMCIQDQLLTIEVVAHLVEILSHIKLVVGRDMIHAR